MDDKRSDLPVLVAGGGIGARHFLAQRFEKLGLEALPACRQLQQPLPSVERADGLLYQLHADKVCQHSGKRLLGDRQQTEQV